MIVRQLIPKQTLSNVYVPTTSIEAVDLNCNAVIYGQRENLKYKYWTFQYQSIEKELYGATDICSKIRQYFVFEKAPLSKEEANYPLSYGLLVYKDIVQVMLELSIFYHPQNAYCIVVDQSTSQSFKDFISKLPTCFPNIDTFIGTKSIWGSFGILENVYKCFKHLTESKHPWKYYQYLSGADLPLRTNLEMVRIMKALNGSINTDVEQFEQDRYRLMEGIHPPVPLYKSAMSVAIPRKSATFMLKSPKVKALLTYLSQTWVPDESFWTTVAGNAVLMKVPGSYRARDILWLRKHLIMDPPDSNTVDNVGTSYIGRYQVWEWQKPCRGRLASWSCVFGVMDVPEIVKRPELVVHKVYLDTEPAAFMCLLKEVRHRSHNPIEFDASSYAEMPTVELSNGKRITELKHPEWLMRSSFYRPSAPVLQ
ncbi:hypothetical protein Q1695_001125 [Nippostrongylus brasiliensis]|nr:hypothetical protein Q1695_001125 [Nippostrongylus brasiliensis]